jgi:AcrR family transcriptional regulator
MTAQGNIKRGRKFDQVLEGARTVFMRDGFEGASVDDIAREAGVSKATLYSYFTDKRLLFMEIAKNECRRQADEAVEMIDMTLPADKVLRAAGQRIIAFISSDLGQRVFRICVAESERFPTLAKEFYASGPMLVRERLANYMRKAVERGELAIDDIDLAADQFAEMCKADIHNRILFGVNPSLTRQDADRVIDGAVATFMARYGLPKG